MKHGHTAIVRCLYELCGDRDEEPRALRDSVAAAVVGGHVDILRYLCELPAGQGVNACTRTRGNAVITEAARGGHLDVVRYLCDLPHHADCPAVSSAVNGVRDVVDGDTTVPRCCARLIRAVAHMPANRYYGQSRAVQYMRNAYPLLAPPSNHSRRSSARRPLLVLRALVAACRSSRHRDLVVCHASHYTHVSVGPRRGGRSRFGLFPAVRVG